MGITEFNTLVLHHSDGLKPFAISLTRDHHSANDLCQETLYKAFAYRDKYEQGTNIKAWLYTIMRNIFINEYRRQTRKKSVMEAYALSLDSNGMASDSQIRLKEVHQAIHSLPAIFKTVCLLYLQGFKYHEIALAINEPLGTVKSRIHFAKKMLQKQIDR